ncbi:MAG: hypothetical protein ACTSYQ_02290 [Candidatus Odinarchaeia archaeon]
MPEGLIIGKWDDVKGVVLHAKYPETVEIADYNLMRIFTSHAVGEAKAGFLSLTFEEENMNVASYFTGMESKPQYFVSLLLSKDEDAKDYEESLLDVATELLEKIDEPNFDELMAEAFERLSKAVRLTDEQRLALMFKDEIHIKVHECLTKGPVSLSKITEHVEESLGVQVKNIELIIAPLMRAGYITQGWIPGFPEQFVFLVRDFFIIRTPSEKTIKLAKKGEPERDVAKQYLNEVKEFFTSYDPKTESSEYLAEFLLNPETYDILILLREKPYRVSELEVSTGKDKLGCENILKKMSEANIVSIFPSNNDNWVLLKSNIQIQSFFPEYLLGVIREELASGGISAETAIRHLEFLEQNYSP